MTIKITELEELRENLRKAWFYANKAAEIAEEGCPSEDILDEIQEVVEQISYINMAVDAEIDEAEMKVEVEEHIARNKQETEKLKTVEEKDDGELQRQRFIEDFLPQNSEE